MLYCLRVCASVTDRHLAVHAGNLQLGIVSEECVSPPSLLMLHTLQHVAVSADTLQDPEYLDRRPDIRKDLPADRYDLITFSQFLCFF